MHKSEKKQKKSQNFEIKRHKVAFLFFSFCGFQGSSKHCYAVYAKSSSTLFSNDCLYKIKSQLLNVNCDVNLNNKYT